ncbi:hypothetical protein F9K88_22580, partial [Brucella intermedia]
AAKLESNDDATGWLAPEIDDLRNRVRDAERKVADYRASRGLLIGQRVGDILCRLRVRRRILNHDDARSSNGKNLHVLAQLLQD